MQISMNNITLLLPVWNEAIIIRAVLDEIRAVPELKQLQLIVVNDGSSDETEQVLNSWANGREHVRLLHLPHGGKDQALWAGIRAVTTEWIAMMDADGQYDPKDILALTDYCRSDVDGIWGKRVARHDSPWRKRISAWGKRTKSLILGSCMVSDTGCGIWIARTSRLIAAIDVCPDPAGQVHCHLPELIATCSGCVKESPINHRSRLGGQAKFGALNRLWPGLRSLLQARRGLTQLRKVRA